MLDNDQSRVLSGIYQYRRYAAVRAAMAFLDDLRGLRFQLGEIKQVAGGDVPSFSVEIKLLCQICGQEEERRYGFTECEIAFFEKLQKLERLRKEYPALDTALTNVDVVLRMIDGEEPSDRS